MSENNNNNGKDKFITGLQVVQWLEEVGLSEHLPIQILIQHGLKTRNFDSLQRFLARHPKLLTLGKARFELTKLLAGSCPFYPFPKLEGSQGDPILGVEAHTGAPFRLSVEHLKRHVLAYGGTGWGKTNTIKTLLLGLHQNALSNFWVFDLKKEYWRLKSAIPDLIIVNPHNFWDNPFEKPSANMPDNDWINIICQVFERELFVKTSSKSKLMEALISLFHKNMLSQNSESYPTCYDVLRELSYLRDREKVYQSKSSYDPLINRFKMLTNIQNYFSAKKSIPVEELSTKNIIFDLSGVVNEIYSIIACTLISKLYHYRMYERGNHNMHVVVVDEARAIFDADRDRMFEFGEPVINTMLSRSREYNLGFVLATQEPSSISNTAKSNAYTTLAFSMSYGPEVASVKQSMLMSSAQLEFYKNLDIGTAIVKHGSLSPFVLQVSLLKEPSYLPTETEIAADAEAFLSPYREKKPQAKPEACRIVPAGEETSNDGSEVVPPDSQKVLYVLIEHPFLKYTEVQEECGFGGAKMKKATEWLLQHGFATEQPLKASKARPSRFLPLTEKAFQLLKAKPPKGKGSFKSKLHCHLVKKWLEKHGWTAKIEGKTEHSDKLIDVLGFKKGLGYVAYEISNSLDNLLENIEKDLTRTKVGKVVLVFEDNISMLEGKKRHFFQSISIEGQVEFRLIEEFFL